MYTYYPGKPHNQLKSKQKYKNHKKLFYRSWFGNHLKIITHIGVKKCLTKIYWKSSTF